MVEASSVSLRFREFRDSDLEAVLRLWERDSEWGPITKQQWREWFIETPHGAAPVAVAVNRRNEVVGQCVGVPSRILLDGMELRALRLSAPIVQPTMRGGALLHEDHPVVGLLKRELQLARNYGFSIVYALPRRGFLPFFRWLPSVGLPSFAEAQFGCLESSMSTFHAASQQRDGELTVRVGSCFGDEYDDLWATAIKTHSIRCGAVRASRYLDYKLGSHIVLEVRRSANESLQGYVAVKRTDGLLMDILTRSPECLIDVLGTAMRFLASHGDFVGNDTVQRINAMVTPSLNASLAESGFRPAKFTFAFVCCSIDDSVAQDRITPDRWYLMPGD